MGIVVLGDRARVVCDMQCLWDGWYRLVHLDGVGNFELVAFKVNLLIIIEGCNLHVISVQCILYILDQKMVINCCASPCTPCGKRRRTPFHFQFFTLRTSMNMNILDIGYYPTHSKHMKAFYSYM